MKTKALSILMAIFLAFSVASVSIAFAADVNSQATLLTASNKKTVKLSTKKTTIYYKGTKTLKLLNNKKKVTWSSSNKKVATVSSKGKVTAKGLGTAKITAKVGKKKYTCKVTVKDRNVGTAIGFVTEGGGYFIKDESVAKVTIRPKKYNCAKAVVSIKNAAGDTVYTKTYKNLKKNTNYSFTWDATDNKGNELPAGSYKVSVKIGNTVSNSAYLVYKNVNDFDGGNGSASNPFEVGSTTQLAKIVKYPSANFKQTEDLDFGYEATGGFFTTDLPFGGVYDGNGKEIMNISATTALFNVVGEKGVIKNVVMKSCSVVGKYGAILVNRNYGNVNKCNINGMVSNDAGRAETGGGILASDNYGTISNCETSGNVSANESDYAGGIARYNHPGGKIVYCISHTNVSASDYPYKKGDSYSGGIVAINSGLISNCEADGIITADHPGGIAGKNEAQINSSSYTGSSSISAAGKNNGTIA